MTVSPRFWDVFFDLYEGLPRQGPGNRASAVRALSLCAGLPTSPAILDLGCGVGAQTLYLAELTTGTIIAIDRHVPHVERLRAAVVARGLSDRVDARVGDMACPEIAPGSLDLVWSEGALYNIGIAQALLVCRGLLRPGGYVVFTDAVWRTANPPADVKAGFDAEYPGMGTVDDGLLAIRDAGFEVLGHFTLPDEAWWDEFYTPMARRIEDLRAKYAGDAEASEVLDQLAQEPEMHRQFSEAYAYEFFVTRRAD